MCIRDSRKALPARPEIEELEPRILYAADMAALGFVPQVVACLLYTSDAADERSSVDLGGCPII